MRMRVFTILAIISVTSAYFIDYSRELENLDEGEVNGLKNFI